MAAEDILEWVKKQPKWYAVGLRMLADKDKLDQEQVDTLAALACKEHDISTPFGDISDNHPVNQSHLGALLSNTSEIRIDSIAAIKNANRIKENAALTFNQSGLTVIYGDNGAGKTGYARLFKRTCTARDTGDCILPNIYESANGDLKANATFKYTENGTTQSLDWEDSESLDVIFPQVSFFDTGCGEVEISKKNEVTYLNRPDFTGGSKFEKMEPLWKTKTTNQSATPKKSAIKRFGWSMSTKVSILRSGLVSFRLQKSSV